MKLLIITITTIFISFGASSSPLEEVCSKVKRTIIQAHNYYTEKGKRFVDGHVEPRPISSEYRDYIEGFSNIWKNLNCGK